MCMRFNNKDKLCAIKFYLLIDYKLLSDPKKLIIMNACGECFHKKKIVRHLYVFICITITTRSLGKLILLLK